MTASAKGKQVSWSAVWPDALAFAGGLAMAWYFDWQSRDLVWSLWLSSLVIGYAMIVWSIFGTAIFLATKAWTDRAMLRAEPKVPLVLGGSVLLVGGLFLLAFFTFHFGMFHFVHSVFLNFFFPMEPGGLHVMPGPALYWKVVQDYWWMLPAVAVAERRAFRFAPEEPAAPPDTAVTVEAIAARKARNAGIGGFTGLMAPYKNVVRLHLLIFFFAFAHFTKFENFPVYALVYAVYFFPWRLVRREKS